MDPKAAQIVPVTKAKGQAAPGKAQAAPKAILPKSVAEMAAQRGVPSITNPKASFESWPAPPKIPQLKPVSPVVPKDSTAIGSNVPLLIAIPKFQTSISEVDTKDSIMPLDIGYVPNIPQVKKDIAESQKEA